MEDRKELKPEERAFSRAENLTSRLPQFGLEKQQRADCVAAMAIFE